jgi:hypothetical protein
MPFMHAQMRETCKSSGGWVLMLRGLMVIFPKCLLRSVENGRWKPTDVLLYTFFIFFPLSPYGSHPSNLSYMWTCAYVGTIRRLTKSDSKRVYVLREYVTHIANHKLSSIIY